ncbi:MAG: hypothetical protein K2Q20_11940 [Phycisphaerales bacterium]|nr:hypothetical protein [Phycisphaerales bacterium]
MRWPDLAADPVWEFVYDEANHMETALSPASEESLRVGAEEAFDGVVRATLTAPNGREFNGAVWVNSALDCTKDPEIWTDTPADEVVLGPLPDWDPIICKGAFRYGFGLPWPGITPDEEARRLFRLVYATLGTTAGELWPLRVRPAFALPDGTTEFLQHGWLRPALEDGVREVLR